MQTFLTDTGQWVTESIKTLVYNYMRVLQLSKVIEWILIKLGQNLPAYGPKQ